MDRRFWQDRKGIGQAGTVRGRTVTLQDEWEEEEIKRTAAKRKAVLFQSHSSSFCSPAEVQELAACQTLELFGALKLLGPLTG